MVLVALALIAGVSRTARAEDSANAAAAQALFDEAKKQMAAGQYDRACPALVQAQKLDPGLGTLLNLANCYEKAGKTASAWTTFVEAQAIAQRAGRTEAERVAKERAAGLVKRLAKLTIAVPYADKVSGLEVTRDGVKLGAAEYGLPIPVDPGPHTVGALAPGRKRWETSLVVAGATEPRVVVPELEPAPAEAAVAVLPAEPKPAEPPSAAAGEPSESGKPSHARRNIGLVVGGVGLAAVAAGGVFAGLTKSKDGEADKLCTGGDGNTCANNGEKIKYEETVSAAKLDRTLSIVCFSVGAAALATGAVLIFGGSKGSGQGTLSVMPVAGPGEAGVLARGRF